MKLENHLAKVVIQNKGIEVGEEGERMFDDTVKNIRKNIKEASLPKGFWFIKKGTTPENIQDILRENLLEDPKITVFAPVTQEALDNPTPTQDKWINLYIDLFGRKPVKKLTSHCLK